MGMLKKIFTWWDGATIGTALHSWRTGRQVGTDSLGNVYYEGKKDGRRWVIYSGENDASAVAPEWHAWLHGQIDGLPDDVLPPARPYQKPYTRNLTGTNEAYLPSGALERGGQRQASGGDYEAWTPN